MLHEKYLCFGRNTKIFDEFKLFQEKFVDLTNDLPEYQIDQILYQNVLQPRWSYRSILVDSKNVFEQ